MCARRRSNFLLRRLGPVTKEKATPLSVSPSLRYGATCGAPFRRGPRKLASLRCAQTARGPDPPEAVLLGTARGDWAQHPFGPSLRSAPRAGASAAHALGPDHDAAQRNSRSDPNPGTVGAARVLCHSCLRPCIALEMTSGCCRPKPVVRCVPASGRVCRTPRQCRVWEPLINVYKDSLLYHQ